MLNEKWNDVFKKMFLASYPIGHSVTVVNANDTTTEIVFQSMKDLHIALVLHDSEFR